MSLDQASRLRALVDDSHRKAAAPPPLPLAPEFQKLNPEEDLAEVKNYAVVQENERRTPPPEEYGGKHQMQHARIIAITSGKGGVGKTNLTVNLAVALKELGRRVIILDADLGMANVDVVLGSTSKKSLLNLLDEGVRLTDILTHGPHGIDYIAGGSGLDHLAVLTADKRQTLWEKLAEVDARADLVLIDTGAGIGRNVMNFILAADEVVLVTTPEPTALTDAYALMKAYSRYEKGKPLKLVVNRVYDDADCDDVVAKLTTTAERFLGLKLEFAGQIYEDRNVLQSVRRQTPFTVADKGTVASRCVRSLAKRLLTGQDSPVVEKTWRDFLSKFF